MYDRYSSDRTNNSITEDLVAIRDYTPNLLRSDKDTLADACNRIQEQGKDIERLTELLLRIYPFVIKTRNALSKELGYDANDDIEAPPEVGALTDWLFDMAIATTNQTLAERYEKWRELAREIGVLPQAR